MLHYNICFAGESVEPEALNKKALDIVQRVRDKLTGRDFNKEVGAEAAEHYNEADFVFVAGESEGGGAGGPVDCPGHQSRELVPMLHRVVSILVVWEGGT